MSPYLMDAVGWIFGVRGHIPRDDGFGAGSNRSPQAVADSRLIRILVAVIVAGAFLSLVLWAAVWLALKLL